MKKKRIAEIYKFPIINIICNAIKTLHHTWIGGKKNSQIKGEAQKKSFAGREKSERKTNVEGAQSERVRRQKTP